MARKIIDPDEIFWDKQHQNILLKNDNKFDPVLYTNIFSPSAIHNYSLGIEYMKKYFLDRMPANYFNFVWVNGSHMMDDFRSFNKQHIKRETPYMAMIPSVDLEYDRENVDMYYAGPNVFLKRSNWQGSFFKDYTNNSFLHVQLRAMKMPIQYRIRLNTRAQQYDMYRRMEMMFKLGGTIKDWISTDFVLPHELTINMAYLAGFEIDKTGEIADPLKFLAYLNAHSDIPITYKFRGINGHNEYFIRMSDIYVHISTLEKLEVDDGERVGQLDINFGITMNAILTMAVPQFFVLYDQKELRYRLKVNNAERESIGIYTMAQFEIPDVNEKGWNQIINTVYQLDKDERVIDISPMYASNKTQDIMSVVNYCNKNFISPKCFIEVRVYQNKAGYYQQINIGLNYKTMEMTLTGEFDENEYIYIAIYIDMQYMNETLITLGNFYENRISDQAEASDIPGLVKEKEDKNKGVG